MNCCEIFYYYLRMRSANRGLLFRIGLAPLQYSLPKITLITTALQKQRPSERIISLHYGSLYVHACDREG